jgi:Cu/Ag efflux pump CusA
VVHEETDVFCCLPDLLAQIVHCHVSALHHVVVKGNEFGDCVSTYAHLLRHFVKDVADSGTKKITSVKSSLPDSLSVVVVILRNEVVDNVGSQIVDNLVESVVQLAALQTDKVQRNRASQEDDFFS